MKEIMESNFRDWSLFNQYISILLNRYMLIIRLGLFILILFIIIYITSDDDLLSVLFNKKITQEKFFYFCLITILRITLSFIMTYLIFQVFLH